MRIGLLLIGDELLTGELDPYPSKILDAIRAKGASVSRIAVVPDEVSAIVQELDASCLRGTGLLLVTGGLGPTIDDVTRHALAAFLGKELVIDEGARGWTEEGLLVKHGKKPKPSSASMLMAMVPEGTEALRNPAGVACGIRVRVRSTTIICVPGFPKEMWAMFQEYMLPMLEDEGVYEKEMRVFRRESTMEPLFQSVSREFGVRIASLPKDDWRESGNVVIIKGPRERVEKAASKFLEMVAATKDEYEDQV